MPEPERREQEFRLLVRDLAPIPSELEGSRFRNNKTSLLAEE